MGVLIEQSNLHGVEAVIVFPAYNEAANLGEILVELAPRLDSHHLVIIADDSGEDYRLKLEEICDRAFGLSKASLAFSYSETKSGRGAAVRRAFKAAMDLNPEIKFYMESDSDGSHRSEDILNMFFLDSDADLIIGSRYSPGSRISGWPLQRRVFSRILNLTVPVVLSVRSRDLTNGLRRYKTEAVSALLDAPAVNAGFIYLSEVAYLLSEKGFSIQDVPIHFKNRIYGESTVGREEISASLVGLWKLVGLRLRDIASR